MSAFLHNPEFQTNLALYVYLKYNDLITNLM